MRAKKPGMDMSTYSKPANRPGFLVMCPRLGEFSPEIRGRLSKCFRHEQRRLAAPSPLCDHSAAHPSQRQRPAKDGAPTLWKCRRKAGPPAHPHYQYHSVFLDGKRGLRDNSLERCTLCHGLRCRPTSAAELSNSTPSCRNQAQKKSDPSAIFSG